MVAALFVLADGIYSGVPGVELWDRERDAGTMRGLGGRSASAL